MKICGMDPITPAISVGAIYLIIIGDIVMKQPTQTPCKNLPKSKQ
jgi:hypothetical protein